MNSPNLCIRCKGGRNLCGNAPCPLLSKIKIAPKIKKLSQEFFGPSTSVFVGHSGYPNVNIGPVGAIELQPGMDNPGLWFGKEYSAIVEMRSLTLRSKKAEHVKGRDKFVGENQLIAMAKIPTDVEMKFKSTPTMKVSFSDVTQPMGPSAEITNLKITENPVIPQYTDYVVNDEIKAAEQVSLLYKRFDLYYATNILSSGALGISQNQKLVPTRWSITAVDDMLAKEMMKRIREYPSINEFLLFESRYLDNYFAILMMPGKWEYENFEAWSPGSFWAKQIKDIEVSQEYEPYMGRTAYADVEGGGYYAARLGVCEALDRMKRQARVIVFREINEGYVIPVGVWQVRENSRNATKQSAKKFSTLNDVFAYLRTKLKVPLEKYQGISKILRQKRISDF